MVITVDRVKSVGLYVVGLVSHVLEAKRNATTDSPRARGVQSRPFNAAILAKQRALHHIRLLVFLNSPDRV
jgi:hypothetical protein